MNSITLSIENDATKHSHQLLNLTFSKDIEGDVNLAIHYEDLDGIGRDIWICHESLAQLPKMLRLLADFLED